MHLTVPLSLQVNVSHLSTLDGCLCSCMVVSLAREHPPSMCGLKLSWKQQKQQPTNLEVASVVTFQPLCDVVYSSQGHDLLVASSFGSLFCPKKARSSTTWTDSVTFSRHLGISFPVFLTSLTGISYTSAVTPSARARQKWMEIQQTFLSRQKKIYVNLNNLLPALVSWANDW